MTAVSDAIDARAAATVQALHDLSDFLEDENNAALPPLTWCVGYMNAQPSVSAMVGIGGLKTVLAFADAINTGVYVKRDSAEWQTVSVHRADAINGRTEMYVYARSKIDCGTWPPSERTWPNLLAERDWVTRARVTFRRDVHVDGRESGTYCYRTGTEWIMVQQGKAWEPVRPVWRSSFDTAGAFVVDAGDVDVTEVLSYTPPVHPWEEVSGSILTGHHGQPWETRSW